MLLELDTSIAFLSMVIKLLCFLLLFSFYDTHKGLFASPL
ncbi:hypothetical protein HMPREF1345_02420 [Enterococcus faecium TX1337RF]|nr:hypothetical protein HMPREF1345_02420 [Enterococcus faecium TX1337RF]